MIRLISFELKKIWKLKYIWALLVAFLIINGYKIYQVFQTENIVGDDHYEIYEQVKGEITSSKVRFVTEHYKKYLKLVKAGNFSKEGGQEGTYTGYIMGDYVEFENFYQSLKVLYQYADNAEVICKQAEENISFYGQKGNSYEVQRNKKIRDAFSGRKIKNYYEMHGMQTYLEYDFSTLLMLLMVLAGISGMWHLEDKSSMCMLLKTGSLPMGIIMFGKICCAGIISFLFVLVFSAEDFIGFNALYHLEGFYQPLYAMEDYFLSGYSGSVLGYIFITILLKCAALLFFAICIYIFSYLLTDSVKTVCAGSLLFSGMVWICVNTKWYINPVALFACSSYFQTMATVNVFGCAVGYLDVVLAVLTMLDIVFVAMVCFWGNRYYISNFHLPVKLQRGGNR